MKRKTAAVSTRTTVILELIGEPGYAVDRSYHVGHAHTAAAELAGQVGVELEDG